MTTTYEITYSTHNTYEEDVREALFSFLVIPCQDETQKLKSLRFSNSLQLEAFQYQNTFGFEVAQLYNARPFKELGFQMIATVEKEHRFLPFGNYYSLQEEQSLLQDYNFYIEHHLFLGTGYYTTIDQVYTDKVLIRQENESVYNYLNRLNLYVYQMLEFDPEPTHVCTTVNEVLKLGKGVCQDFTHLFIALARRNKIPCRYVSGYLNQGLNLTGTAVMHAWAEAFIPGFGWQGYDPTNNLLADFNYIKVAHGCDYNDCSPLKGVLKTNGRQKTTYGVKVYPLLLSAHTEQ
ncbi:transglutaminase-like domain-containing protein [Adhaeribacter aquaticus]|uniref:transglutaminase-like domain-containing protein n=1 Tax=Adhaeribacter aquaticus TaxID=299567 RepID=UPI0003F4F1FA|nr:transglutaminase family protein [Adhaeribacter aquaticus]